MKCKKIKSILTKSELKRIKEIYQKELPKIIKDEAVTLYNEDFIDAICCDYHKWFLKYMKNYNSKKDKLIKSKIKNAIKNWSFDFGQFEEKLKQPFHKYKKKDWTKFLKISEYFFNLHKGLAKSILEKERDYYLDRIYLGCGFEFLLKAIFLRKGYLINKISSRSEFQNLGLTIPQHPIKLGQLTKQLIKSEINNFNYFIDQLNKIKPQRVEQKYFDYYILAGLKIAQSWRNQDIHIPAGLRRTTGEYENHLKWAHDYLYKLFLPKTKISAFSFGLSLK